MIFSNGNLDVIKRLDAGDDKPDIQVQGLGTSVVVMEGMTETGVAWIDEYVQHSDPPHPNTGGRYVEARYMQTIMEGAADAGLIVEVS